MEAICLWKSFFCFFCVFTCVLTLVACGKMQFHYATSNRRDYIYWYNCRGNTVSHSDKTWISEIIANISSSEPTKRKVFKMSHKRKVILRLTFSLRQEQVHFLHMRTVGNTMLNSPIREFIRLTVNCTASYKKPIKMQFV